MQTGHIIPPYPFSDRETSLLLGAFDFCAEYCNDDIRDNFLSGNYHRYLCVVCMSEKCQNRYKYVQQFLAPLYRQPAHDSVCGLHASLSVCNSYIPQHEASKSFSSRLRKACLTVLSTLDK